MSKSNIWETTIIILQLYLLSLAQGLTVEIDTGTELDENGWTTSCAYFATSDDIKSCYSIDQDKIGLWTSCTTPANSCELIYIVSELNALPESLEIAAFMKNGNSDRIVQIKFRPKNGESIDPIRVPQFDGYSQINVNSLDDNLRETGSSIVIALSSYEPVFAMVDKIIQTFASESTTNPTSSSTSTLSMSTQNYSMTTEFTSEESTVSSLSSISTIKSTVSEDLTSISTDFESSYSYSTSTTSAESSTSAQSSTIGSTSSTSVESSSTSVESSSTSNSTLSTNYMSSESTLISSSTVSYSSSFSTPTSELSSILPTNPSTGSTNDLTSMSSNYFSTLSTTSILPSTDYSSILPTTNAISSTALTDNLSTLTTEASTSMHTSENTKPTLPTTILTPTISSSESTHETSTEITTQISTIKPIIVDTKYELEKSNWTTTCDYADEVLGCLNGLESIIDGREGIWTICQKEQTSCIFDYNLEYLTISKVLPFIPSYLAMNFYIKHFNGKEILKIQYESKTGTIIKEYDGLDTWNRVEIDIGSALPNSKLRVYQESDLSSESLVLIDKIELYFKQGDENDEDNEKSTSDKLDNVHIILIAVSAILFMFLFVSIVALIYRKNRNASFEELIDNEFNFGNSQSLYGSNTNGKRY